MRYSYYQEQLTAGDIVEVTLNAQANVLLLDSANYSRFKSGTEYKYYGGLAKVSPVKIPVPYSGLWYVVINLGGYAGTVRHSMRIIKG